MTKKPIDPTDGRPQAAASFVDEGFGERLRALRLRAWLSQEQLAAKVGVHTSIVSRHETGRIKPGPASLHAYAQLFDVSPAYLQYGDAEESASSDQLAVQILQALREASVPPAVREYVTRNPYGRDLLPSVWLSLLRCDRTLWEVLGGDDMSVEGVDKLAVAIDETARMPLMSHDAVDRRQSGDAGGANTRTARGGTRQRVIALPRDRS